MTTRRFTAIILALAMLLAPLNLTPAQAAHPAAPTASIWYVDHAAAGANTGASWVDAFTRLQSALTAAQPGDQIWVAQGIYLPTNVNDLSATFNLKNGVGLYGGFDPANGVDIWAERDWHAHITVLSGDRDGNDITDANGVVTNPDNIRESNFIHVVTAIGVAETARLDGFYVTGGAAIEGSVNGGGGMFVYDNSGPTVANVVFIGNWGNSGGGLYSRYHGDTHLFNVTFVANEAAYGGGLCSTWSSNISLVNVAFYNNYAVNGGGMLNDDHSTASLANVIFSGNGASYGGGMGNTGQSTASLVNTTFSGNYTTDWGRGGGINNAGNGQITLSNSIVWGNSASKGKQIYNDSASISTLHNSVLQSNCPTGSTCEVLIQDDPLFVRDASSGPDGNWGTGDDDHGDLHLQVYSPAINAGKNAYVPADTFDLDGNGNTSEKLPFDLDSAPRINNQFVDIGAFEFRRLYVDHAATGSNNGSSWANAFTSLQPAMAQARTGDQIWVAQGIYIPTSASDRTATFTLKTSVALYGGFDPASGADGWTERDWQAHPTVLSGDLDGNDLKDVHGVVTSTANIVGDNAYHVLSSNGLTQTARLEGFYITAGKADGGYPLERGGGMYNHNSNPILVNLAFSANQAGEGGGMYNENSNPSLVNVAFVANQAYDGGGMLNNNSSPSLANIVFVANLAGYGGGGMYNNNSSPSLVNATFAANQATYYGGGMHNYYGSNPTISNSILWGNNAPIGAQVHNDTNAAPTLRYSDVKDGCPAGSTCESLINTGPLFMRPPSPGSDGTWGTSDDDYGNLYVKITSPVIEAGNNAYLPIDGFDLDGDRNITELLPFDLARQPRILGAVVDMGAYEAFRLWLPLVTFP